MTGKVYLVGAGPGDPGLITVKGREILQRADVVLYDHLASTRLLELARPAAERIYVGKKRAQHACSQEEIGELLIDRARRGLTVVRLKGGDPFIFGRGGEEVEQLAAAGIPFEVVPGVTAPLGIAAYTGVPLTHRDHTSVVTFVTGHSMDVVRWESVAGSETLVIFMGLHHLSEITERLIAAGRSPETPAMAVEWATTPRQRTVSGRLRDLAGLVSEQHIQPPATIIVGSVVELRDRLSWFDKLPLLNTRVIVTRARAQSADLVQALHSIGAEPIELPVIEMTEPENTSALEACVDQLESYDWLVFTSSNAVDYFIRHVDDLRRVRSRICAVGQATASALRAHRLGVDLVPEKGSAEGIAAAFSTVQMYEARVLFPRAAGAREVVPAALSAKGALVDAPVAYRNVVPADAARSIQSWLASNRSAHWITFTSPSTVTNFLSLAGHDALTGVAIATIGGTTSEAVRAAGLSVTVEAAEPSTNGLLQAILHHHR